MVSSGVHPVNDVSTSDVIGYAGFTNVSNLFVTYDESEEIYRATISFDDTHQCTKDFGTTHEFFASGRDLPFATDAWRCTVCGLPPEHF